MRPLDDEQRRLLDTLARELGPRVAAYVRRVYGRMIDVEEVVAETFLRAARNIEAVRKCERADYYLFTIARNLCRTSFRRAPMRTIGDERMAAEASPAVDPSEATVRREREIQLLSAVAELPEAMREVVVLRLSASMKFEEIAELLGIPLGTALSRMHDAVKRLRVTLGAEHEPKRKTLQQRV